MGLKEAFLNKGWAGTTMSRPETIDRINPLIHRQYELNHAYNYAINHVSQRDAAARLEALQKGARADVGKLSETVLSAGGVSYNGIDLEPESFTFSGSEHDMIRALTEQEEQFHELLSDELSQNHHIRTLAVLSVVRANSAERLEYLRSLANTNGGKRR